MTTIKIELIGYNFDEMYLLEDSEEKTNQPINK